VVVRAANDSGRFDTAQHLIVDAGMNIALIVL